MKDSFIFEGKKYISARRASKISDYSSDYIGQLCRAEKLDSRMIGRAWFITEESLHLHQANVLHDEIARNRIENLRGKKSKAASRSSRDKKSAVSAPSAVSAESVGTASLATGVTGEKSDVHEMERASGTVLKINRISDTDSIVSPYSAIPRIKRERPSTPADERVPKISEPEREADSAIAPLAWKKTFLCPDDKPRSLVSGMVYSADDRPLLPILKKPRGEAFTAAPLRKKVARESREVVPVKLTGRRIKSDVSLPFLARSIILNRALATAFAIAVIVGLGAYSANYIGKEASRLAVSAVSLQANIYEAFDAAVAFIGNQYRAVVAFFTVKPMRLSINEPPVPNQPSEQPAPPEPAMAPTENGLAVIPSSGESEQDKAVKQKIQNSFSDQVEVNPDQSGTAGVITPIFRENKGKDFIYVMVPVKEKSDAAGGN